MKVLTVSILSDDSDVPSLVAAFPCCTILISLFTFDYRFAPLCYCFCNPLVSTFINEYLVSMYQLHLTGSNWEALSLLSSSLYLNCVNILKFSPSFIIIMIHILKIPSVPNNTFSSFTFLIPECLKNSFKT